MDSTLNLTKLNTIENIFYPAIIEPYSDIGSYNRYNLSQALKNISPKELDSASKAIKNITLEAIKQITNLMKRLP